jgi:Cupredoxin-like domain
VTRRLLVFAVLSAAFVACSGGGSSHHATCRPSGPSPSISADHVRFSTDCLAAPANQPFTIDFDNEDDGVPHNVDILSSKNEQSVFKGQITTGSKDVTYHVEGLKPGVYTFRCDVHPDSMQGTFIVR